MALRCYSTHSDDSGGSVGVTNGNGYIDGDGSDDNGAGCKLKLTFTSPNIISTSPKNVLTSRLISQFFCNLNSSKKIHLPIGQVYNKIH